MAKKIEIQEGQKFGRLSIIKEIEPHIYPSGKPRRKYLCKCDCGNETKVTINHLKSHTKSCGCLNNEQRIKTHTTHGEGNKNKTVEYICWGDMKRRCSSPKIKQWKDYGGRGIKVCDRWLNSYENFLQDMGRKPKQEYSLDRINNDGNYEPNNCRWATPSEQVNNRRKKMLNES